MRGGATTPQHPTLHPAAPKLSHYGSVLWFWPPAPLLPLVWECVAPPPPLHPLHATTSPHHPPPLFQTACPKSSCHTWFHQIWTPAPSPGSHLQTQSPTTITTLSTSSH